MAEAVTIARPYAVAVFRLAKEKNALATWSDTLAFLGAVVVDPAVQALVDDPKVEPAALERLLIAVGSGKLDHAAVNLVKLLVENNRLQLLPEIAAIFEALKAQDEGTLEAEVTGAVELTDAQLKSVVSRLQQRFGKKIEASVKVDPGLVGGIKIVIGDTVIDASVRGRLQELAYTLKG